MKRRVAQGPQMTGMVAGRRGRLPTLLRHPLQSPSPAFDERPNPCADAVDADPAGRSDRSAFPVIPRIRPQSDPRTIRIPGF